MEAYGDEQVYYAEFMIQLGMIYMLPLFINRAAENGLWVAIKEFVSQVRVRVRVRDRVRVRASPNPHPNPHQFFSLKFLFGLFEMRTSMYYLDRGLRRGRTLALALALTLALT